MGIPQPAGIPTATTGAFLPGDRPGLGWGLVTANTEVTLQLIRVLETPGTDGAAVCSINIVIGISMNPHVPFQRVPPHKFLLAHATLVCLLLGVGSVVAAQLRNGREILPAVAARVRLQAGVNPHVQIQIPGNPKPPRAHCARVSFGHFIVGGSRLPTGTQTAGVRILWGAGLRELCWTGVGLHSVIRGEIHGTMNRSDVSI